MATNYRELARDGQPFKFADFEFRELQRQEYTGNGCVFAVGLVDGAGVDAYYLWLEKDEFPDPTILLLRPDEVVNRVSNFSDNVGITDSVSLVATLDDGSGDPYTPALAGGPETDSNLDTGVGIGGVGDGGA